MTAYQVLDADELMRHMAKQVPLSLRPNVVVIGSIATAWAFRNLRGAGRARTKHIDLLLQPAIDAVATATVAQRCVAGRLEGSRSPSSRLAALRNEYPL